MNFFVTKIMQTTVDVYLHSLGVHLSCLTAKLPTRKLMFLSLIVGAITGVYAKQHPSCHALCMLRHLLFFLVLDLIFVAVAIKGMTALVCKLISPVSSENIQEAGEHAHYE